MHNRGRGAGNTCTAVKVKTVYTGGRTVETGMSSFLIRNDLIRNNLVRYD